jgi:hypothetical protein
VLSVAKKDASATMTHMQKTKQIVLFLAIVAFIVAVWFLAGRSSVLETGVERDTTKVSVPAPSGPTAAPTAYDPTVATTVPKTGWKIYNNSEYGFAFDYPPEYELRMHTPEEKNILFSLSVSKNDKSLPQTEAPNENSPFFVSVERGALSDSVNSLTNSGIENVSVTNISVNGLSGKWISMEYGFTGDLENYVLLENDKKQLIRIYYFQYSGSGSPMYAPNTVFDTVLQSVRPYP